MPATIVRDLTHPDFPHGQPVGYRRGCVGEDCPATPTCHAARLRQRRAGEYALACGRGTRERTDSAPAIAHLEYLLATVPGSTYVMVAAQAGIHVKTLASMRARPTARVVDARKILAVTPEQLDARAAHVDAEATRVAIRRMQAAGFPLTWQEQRTGIAALPGLVARRGHERVTSRPATIARIDALFAEVGHREADPELDGIDPREIARAKTVGRRAGFYPPSAYDEEGNLDLRLWPEHTWCKMDRAAARNVEMLYALATIGVREGQPTARAAIGEDNVSGKKLCQRLVARTGMTFIDARRRDLGPAEVAVRNAALIRRTCDVYSDYSIGLITPLEAAIALDVTPRLLDNDHPDLVAMRQREAATGAATEAAGQA